jgi:hypothetical protein
MAVYIPSVTQHLSTLNFLHVIYGKVGLYRHTPIIFMGGGGLNLRQYIICV